VAKGPSPGAEVFSAGDIEAALQVNVQFRLMRYFADYKDERARKGEIKCLL
jgi:hypothetical protein